MLGFEGLTPDGAREKTAVVAAAAELKAFCVFWLVASGAVEW